MSSTETATPHYICCIDIGPPPPPPISDNLCNFDRRTAASPDRLTPVARHRTSVTCRSGSIIGRDGSDRAESDSSGVAGGGRRLLFRRGRQRQSIPPRPGQLRRRRRPRRLPLRPHEPEVAGGLQEAQGAGESDVFERSMV